MRRRSCPSSMSMAAQKIDVVRRVVLDNVRGSKVLGRVALDSRAGHETGISLRRRRWAQVHRRRSTVSLRRSWLGGGAMKALCRRSTASVRMACVGAGVYTDEFRPSYSARTPGMRAMPVFDVAGERRDECPSLEVVSVGTDDVRRCGRLSTDEPRSPYSARASSMRATLVFGVAGGGSSS